MTLLKGMLSSYILAPTFGEACTDNGECTGGAGQICDIDGTDQCVCNPIGFTELNGACVDASDSGMFIVFAKVSIQ